MIDRASAGLLPAKPHTVHKTADGRLLYEEMFTRGGFDGPFSYLYHLFPVTAARRVEASSRGWPKATLVEAGVHPLKRRLYDANPAWAGALARGGQLVDARTPILFNESLVVLLAAPTRSDDVYFANNDGDELFYLVSGKARLESSYGMLDVRKGDYVLVPRSVIHRWHPDASDPPKLLVVEGRRGVHVPASYRNMVGQLTMNAPYVERDFIKPRGPIATPDTQPDGPTGLVVKKGDRFTFHELERCPMDVVGWEGFVYPFSFAIEKYQPKTGQIHLPPTVHTTFVGDGYVICSFVPRLTDYHPQAIPCPYPHSSVDCDEVLLYLEGNFTSRRGVGPGCISLHPSGAAHGPHPGAYEASIGSVRTDELAVMIDTFAPLMPTAEAIAIERPDYQDSWQTKK